MGTIPTKSLNHLMNNLGPHHYSFQLSRYSEDSLGCTSVQEGIFELIMPHSVSLLLLLFSSFLCLLSPYFREMFVT